MDCLDEELYPIKSLKLSSLEDGEILSGMGLKTDEDMGLKLIEQYQGNLMYLKDVALLIKIAEVRTFSPSENSWMLHTRNCPNLWA